MYYIKHCSNITCGCKRKDKANTIKNLIGVKYNKLVIVKQIDDEEVECRCHCGTVFSSNVDKLENNDISMCFECGKKYKEKIKLTLDNRNRKELYYIWYMYKQLYQNPKKKFKKEIIDNGIKFFPDIMELENSFNYFYRWAIENKYGESSGKTILERRFGSEDFNSDNCLWTSDTTNAFFEFPKLNQERDYVMKNNNIRYYDEDDEDSEIDYEDMEYEEDDEEEFEINSKQLEEYLEDFKKIRREK